MRKAKRETIAKPIRLYSWRQQLADILSEYTTPITLILAVIVVLLDVFLWRA